MTGRTQGRARCANCGAAVRAKDKFCASCGTPIAAAQAAQRSEASDAGALPPFGGASLQVSGPPADLAEQRKVVTILFADLSGSTPLGERLDPEDLRAILARYFNALARQIQRYEGTIDKYIGDAIMAVFGAPLSHEDDAERAISAALAMQAALTRLNDDLDRAHGVRLALRIGINTGEVVAGLLAGDVQKAYTVVGDAVNTAQRFESAAPLNEILISESTRRLAGHRFELETLAPITLKGKAQPVAAYRVIRPRDEEVPPEASPLVGRVSELERLRDRLGEALAGRGRVIEIVGEAGLGKSRLVAEFRNGLSAGVERWVARAASYETNTPYALVADLLREMFRIHTTDAQVNARDAAIVFLTAYGVRRDEGEIDLLLDILGYETLSALDPESKRRVLIRLLRELLGRVADRAALVLVIEDLHWIDSASAAVLAEVLPDVQALPCLAVTTSRTAPDPSPWPAERLVLGPLDEPESRELIEELFETPQAPAFLAGILARTGGNPFFIEEVVRDLSDAHTGRTGAPKLEAHIPETVQEVVEARLDRLAPLARRTVRPASVIGRSFWYRLLERVVPDTALADGLAVLEQEAFVQRQAIVPELTYAFRQPLIQEVAYQTQLLTQRRATHRAIAQAVESLYAGRLEEFVDLLAYHWDRTDDREKALHWLVRAADRARRLFANDEALALYGAALRRAADGAGPGDAGSILERIGEVQTLIGRLDDAVASFRQAESRGAAADPHAAARLRRLIAVALRAKGAYAEALATLEAARGLATDDDERARVAVQAGMVQFLRGDYAASRPELERAVQLGESLDASDVVAEGLKLLGNIDNNVGSLASADAAYRRSLGLYERIDDKVGIGDVRSNLGSVYRRMGRWEDSLREYRASLAIRERIGHRRGIATCHNNIGEVLRTRGLAAEAIPSYERAIAILDEIGASADAAVVRMNLGAARLETGEVARAREELLEAEERFTQLGRFKFLAELYMHLARADLVSGDADRAAVAAERSLELARAEKVRSQEAVTERVMAEIALARGDRAKARELLERSRATLAELGEAAELARTDEVLARLGG